MTILQQRGFIGFQLTFTTLLVASCPGVMAQTWGAPTSSLPCTAEQKAESRLSTEHLRLQREGRDGMSLMGRDSGGEWRSMVTAATLLEPARAGTRPAFRVVWCGNRAATIRGQLHRFDMLPMTSEAPADILIERAETDWAAALPRCAAAKLNSPVYRFGANGWTVAVGHRTFALDPQAQEEFVFGSPEQVNLDGDDVPDAVLRYEERLGSGRRAFVAALLGCGDGGYALVGAADLGRVGEKVSVTGSSGGDHALRLSGKSGTALYALDPATRALVRAKASKR